MHNYNNNELLYNNNKAFQQFNIDVTDFTQFPATSYFFSSYKNSIYEKHKSFINPFGVLKMNTYCHL